MNSQSLEDRLFARWCAFAEPVTTPVAVIVIGPALGLRPTVVEELCRGFADASQCAVLDSDEIIFSEPGLPQLDEPVNAIHPLRKKTSPIVANLIARVVERKCNVMLSLSLLDDLDMIQCISDFKAAGFQVDVVACVETPEILKPRLEFLNAQLQTALGIILPIDLAMLGESFNRLSSTLTAIEKQQLVNSLTLLTGQAEIILRQTDRSGLVPGTSALSIAALLDQETLTPAQEPVDPPVVSPAPAPAPPPEPEKPQLPTVKTIEAGGRKFRIAVPPPAKPPSAGLAIPSPASIPVPPKPAVPAVGGFRLNVPPPAPAAAPLPRANPQLPPNQKPLPPANPPVSPSPAAAPVSRQQSPQEPPRVINPPSRSPTPESAPAPAPAAAPAQDAAIRYAQLTPEQRRTVDRRKRQQERIRKIAAK